MSRVTAEDIDTDTAAEQITAEDIDTDTAAEHVTAEDIDNYRLHTCREFYPKIQNSFSSGQPHNQEYLEAGEVS